MKIRNFTRLSAFRVATSLVVAFAIFYVFLIDLVYTSLNHSLVARLDRILSAEVRDISLSDPRSVASIIADKATRDPLTHLELFSGRDRLLAGVEAIPPAIQPHDGVPRTLPGGPGMGPQRVLVQPMPWGGFLVAYRDEEELSALREVVASTFLWSGVAAAILAPLLAMALGLPSLRRIQLMSGEIFLIGEGQLARRLPVGGMDDEFDQFARLVNAMIDKVEIQVAQSHAIGDNLAHELRTPLTRLRMMLDRVGRSSAPQASGQHLIEACIAETDNVLARCQGLLRIAAIEVQSRQRGLTPVSLSAVVEQVASIFEPVATEQEKTFLAMVAPEVSIPGDQDLLFEAISNIVENAIQFTPVGARIRLMLQATSEGALIEVRDDGPGMDAEELAQVTRPFYRGRGATGVEGLGLGLSIASAVAKMHGFTLSFADASPGTVVRLLRPQT